MSIVHRILVALALVVLPACDRAGLPDVAPAPETVLVVLVDQSDSGTGGESAWPARVRADVERRLADASSDVLHVLVLGTGGEPGHEPRCLVPWTTLRREMPRMFEDPGVAQAEAERSLAAIEASVAERSAVVASSAILMGADRALDSLRARAAELGGAGVPARMALTVQSDMRETVDVAMRTRIDRAAAGVASLGETPLVLATDDVEVRVCGVSDSDGRGARRRLPPDALRRAWQPVLGAGAPPAWEATCDVARHASVASR